MLRGKGNFSKDRKTHRVLVLNNVEAKRCLPSQQPRSENGTRQHAQQDRAAVPDGNERQRIGGAVQSIADSTQAPCYEAGKCPGFPPRV